MFLGSCAPVAYIIYHEAVIDPSESYSLSTSGATDEFTIQAKSGSLARFIVEANITTASVQEDPESFDDEYLARFKFPIIYKISDANGKVLLSDEIVLAWKDGGSVSKSNEKTSSTGGTLTASTSLDKFIVPADGNVDVAIKIRPDTTYEANYAEAQLHLYEGMIDNTWYVVAAVAMFFTGFVLAMIGFIFTVTGAVNANTQQLSVSHTAADVTHDNNDACQKAMFIQLSAFSGYIIPFGSIIVPVILWQVWREKDPYIDTMGREAVNFQLSMMLYYIICFVLFFVLIGMVLIFAAMIFHLTYIIIGSVQTSRGSNYRYPIIIRFIKA